MWSKPIYLISAILQMCTVSGIRTGRPMSRCERQRFESFRQSGTYTPRCNRDGSFAKMQCLYNSRTVKCWEVDEFGNPTGVTERPIIFPSRQENKARESTRTLQPITNDASRPYFSYTRPDITTENEIVEPNPATTIIRQPITTRPLSKCERMRKRRMEKPLGRSASVIPTCTVDGHFQREQCNVGKTKCWCVGIRGKKIPGTRVRGPNRPNCYPDICGRRFEKRPSRHRRVVGGRQSTPHTWPWQALVLFSDPKHICGATLVKRNWLVTAASCFDKFPKRKSEWNVKLGVHELNSSNEDRLSVEAIHIHEKYKPGNDTHPGDYDVALLQVSSSARIPSNIMPLCLPDNIDFYKQGARCTITGWGHTSYNGSLSRVLREAWVDLVPLDECNSEKSYNGAINERFMCAGYKEGGMDACHFDTGGPLACPIEGGVWALAGIVSWRRSCAQPFKYGVYTNVHEVKSWIEQIIKR